MSIDGDVKVSRTWSHLTSSMELGQPLPKVKRVEILVSTPVLLLLRRSTAHWRSSWVRNRATAGLLSSRKLVVVVSEARSRCHDILDD